MTQDGVFSSSVLKKCLKLGKTGKRKNGKVIFKMKEMTGKMSKKGLSNEKNKKNAKKCKKYPILFQQGVEKSAKRYYFIAKLFERQVFAMNVLSVVLYTIAILIALLLICLILVQPSKGGGFGSPFGGVGEAVFGTKTMSHLSKLTVVLITIFFVVTLALAAISGHKTSTSSSAAQSAAMNYAEETEAPAEPQGGNQP